MLVSYARSLAMCETTEESSSVPSSPASQSCHHGGGAKMARSERPKKLRSQTESVAQPQPVTLAETNPTSDSLSCCPLNSGTFVAGSRTRTNDADDAITL